MRFLCSCAKKGGYEAWRRHRGNGACVAPRPRQPSLETWLRHQTGCGTEGTEGTQGTKGAESSSIKANKTCLLACPPPPYVGSYARRSYGCATSASYRCYAFGLPGIKPNQTGSNQIKPNQTCRGGGASKFDLLVGKDGGRRTARSVKPRQTESNRIKPNQTKSNLRVGWCVPKLGNPMGKEVGERQPSQTQSSLVKPDQTESNQIKPVRGKWFGGGDGLRLGLRL